MTYEKKKKELDPRECERFSLGKKSKLAKVPHPPRHNLQKPTSSQNIRTPVTKRSQAMIITLQAKKTAQALPPHRKKISECCGFETSWRS